MKRKIKYQYTYFIHPFIIKENKYKKYILKLLRNEKINLKIFKKEKDIQLYQYFLPKMSQFLFSSFSFTTNQINKLEKLPIETKAAIISEYPCAILEYYLPKDVHGKTDENSIFFKIQKIEIICFNTGICFLLIKTNVEDTDEFTDVLNFNYKFRDIQKENETITSYKNIHLQTDTFSDITKFTDFIEEITSSKIEAIKLDLDTERFLSYSYICIDQKLWGKDQGFENVENSFIKFSNFLSADDMAQYSNITNKEKAITYSKWKYAKLSVSKQGVALFTSDADMNNYTILPDEFESKYLYTYILNLYKKIYIKKLKLEFSKPQDILKTRKKFVQFTKELWVQEITEDEIGSWLNHEISKKLEIDRLYLEVKNEYDILYKNMKIEKNSKIMIFLTIILIFLLIFNIIKNF